MTLTEVCLCIRDGAPIYHRAGTEISIEQQHCQAKKEELEVAKKVRATEEAERAKRKVMGCGDRCRGVQGTVKGQVRVHSVSMLVCRHTPSRAHSSPIQPIMGRFGGAGCRQKGSHQS